MASSDTAARHLDGTVICGVYNVNRAHAAASLRWLADLYATVACFGHCDPFTHNASTELQAAARHLPPTPARTPATRLST